MKVNNAELQMKFAAMCTGDKTAFEEIYNHMKTPIFTVIFRITRDKSLSEDILQEIFLKIYRSPPTSKITNPRAYIFQMTRNLAIDSVRKQLQFSSLESIENHAYLPADDLPMKMDINSAMKVLPLSESQIVSFHINGELKFREIAMIMNMPLGTVLWKYQRAIKRLKIILSGGIS